MSKMKEINKKLLQLMMVVQYTIVSGYFPADFPFLVIF